MKLHSYISYVLGNKEDIIVNKMFVYINKSKYSNQTTNYQLK